MKYKTLLAPLVVLTTCACAQTPESAPMSTVPARPVEKTATQGLTPDILNQFLLAEIAGQRGELKLAADAYVDLAYKTRDVRIAKRATEVALYSRQTDLAMRSAKLWLELEPESVKAKQTWVSLLVGVGRLNDAKPYLQEMLAESSRPVGESFQQLHALLSRTKDKRAVLDLLTELGGAYASVPEAHLAIAQSAWQAGQTERTTQALDAALNLRPGWEAVALFKGKVLQGKGDEAVADYWREFLAQNPAASRVRLAYAQHLARMGKIAEARGEFQTLHQEAPGNPEMYAAIGLLAMQMNDLVAAEVNLKQALEYGHPDPGAVRMYLGQLDEGQRRYEGALTWYRAIQDGKQVFSARMREAVVLAKLGRTDEALALLRGVKTEGDEERVAVIQNEAQVLREAKNDLGAYATLDKGLAQLPDNPDLLYDHAMAAEKIDRLDVLEKHLRRLIELQPEHAHAYNALGYTLANRTNRIDEAIVLLGKALELSPDDPFILDSMGWAMYKARRLDEAVAYLRRALSSRDDPEIAAHLGEVLWQRGDKDEARQIWQGSLKSHPDNKQLREALSRFQP